MKHHYKQSQDFNNLCITYGKGNYGKCLAGTTCCFCCGKVCHKVKDFPTIAVRVREGKKVASNVPEYDTPNKKRFYPFRSRGTKPDEDDDDVKSLYLFTGMICF